MRLTKERKKAGLTQTALAERAGVTQSTVCDIERGAAVRSSFETLDNLSRALNAEFRKKGIERIVSPGDIAPSREPRLVKGARRRKVA